MDPVSAMEGVASGGQAVIRLEAIVGLLLTVSIAAERLVEIVKGMVPWLEVQLADPVKEGRRKAVLQLLAVASGIVTAWLAVPILAPGLVASGSHAGGVVAVGLLASGGSGMWNAVLSYLLHVKNLKKIEAEKARAD